MDTLLDQKRLLQDAITKVIATEQAKLQKTDAVLAAVPHDALSSCLRELDNVVVQLSYHSLSDVKLVDFMKTAATALIDVANLLVDQCNF